MFMHYLCNENKAFILYIVKNMHKSSNIFSNEINKWLFISSMAQIYIQFSSQGHNALNP